ncbi:MAG TPA: helix-turn-helix domain-containing protein [Planctomycetota bacterium]|nr:helix-turn-helix domain-containing protein [Planctomycetota bacterium]
MADNELLDAREAMQILGINENDLQTLVARGDLRAFRSAGTMKFRRDDVASLKTEKGTEPTIIIPAAGGRKGSGILPAIGAAKPASGVGRAVNAPQENQTGDIVLDDIELMPTDDAANTQQVTAHQSAVDGGATIVESQQTTGEHTVIDNAQTDNVTAAATQLGSSPRRAAPSAPAVAAAPAMSRVRAAVSPGVSMATSRRTHAVYQVKTAGPVWTAFMVLNTIVFVFAASVAAVMITKGSYDKDSGERVIPPFLSHNSTFPVYRWCYTNCPGNPQDKRPESEFGPGHPMFQQQ